MQKNLVVYKYLLSAVDEDQLTTLGNQLTPLVSTDWRPWCTQSP